VDGTEVVDGSAESEVAKKVELASAKGEAWQVHNFESGVKIIERETDRAVYHTKVGEWPENPQVQRMYGIELALRHSERGFRSMSLHDIAKAADEVVAYVANATLPEQRVDEDEKADV
jgi:hypothetical protein